MRVLFTVCLTLLCLLAGPAARAQPARYDAATGVLSIPSVSVGADTYANVSLGHGGDFVFRLRAATPQTPAAPGVARFDPATGTLTLPAVLVGDTTYLDVTLRDAGNLAFNLVAAMPLPATTAEAIQAFMARLDALWATTVPIDGNARYALHDGCYAHDGRTRSWLIADLQAAPEAARQRDLYMVGRRSTNLQVLAVRHITTGGATREEIDIRHDTVHTDGTVARDVRQTLVRGDTRGLAGCSAGQSAADLRFLGNQRLVSVGVRALNLRDERRSITTGAALSPAVNYRRALQFPVTDPLGRATYVVVTGPGPGGTADGAAQPFSLKLLSPRIARSAPEMQGRQGNFLNWTDEDSFRICRSSGSGTPLATVADCTGVGMSGSDIGSTTASPNAAADSSFAAAGYVAGGVYRFDVYADDGWKTVNGQAGRSPIATYVETLRALPYTFVEMAGTGTGADRFARLNFGALTHAQVLARAISASPTPLQVGWNALPALPDGAAFGVFEGWEFHQGARAANANSSFYPAYRLFTEFYPGSQATAHASWPLTPRVDGQASKSYFELALQHQDRSGRRLTSLVSFQ